MQHLTIKQIALFHVKISEEVKASTYLEEVLSLFWILQESSLTKLRLDEVYSLYEPATLLE